MSPLLQIALVVLPIILPPLVGLVTYLVNREIQKLPAATQSLVYDVARTAVTATEQTASVMLNGPGKKQLAVEKVEAALEHYGIHVDPVIVNDAIEEAVKALNMIESDKVDAMATIPMQTIDTKGVR